MTRRRAPLCLLALFALAAYAPEARAISSRTRLCIAAARNARKACVVQCGTDFQNTFTTCFGPGAGCAGGCITAQSNCLVSPVAARTACEKDTDPNPNDGIPEGACAVNLRNDLQCCGDPTCTTKLDPDPTQCASKARLKGIACNEDCILVYAPAVQACNQAFNNCTQGCASCTNPSDCPTPANE